MPPKCQLRPASQAPDSGRTEKPVLLHTLIVFEYQYFITMPSLLQRRSDIKYVPNPKFIENNHLACYRILKTVYVHHTRRLKSFVLLGNRAATAMGVRQGPKSFRLTRICRSISSPCPTSISPAKIDITFVGRHQLQRH